MAELKLQDAVQALRIRQIQPHHHHVESALGELVRASARKNVCVRWYSISLVSLIIDEIKSR